MIHDVKTNGLNAPVPDEIYYPMRQLGRPGMNVIARTAGDPAGLQRVIRGAVAAVDTDQLISPSPCSRPMSPPAWHAAASSRR